MKKLIITILFAINIVLLSNFSTFSMENELISERITVKVGYLENYGIINTPIIQGSEGFGYEYLNKLEKYTNYEFEYISLSWASGLEKLKNGEIDILAPASKSIDREKDYDFVDTMFLHEEISVYALEDSPYNYGEPSQLNNKVIGTFEGGIYEQKLAEFASRYNLEYTIKHTDPATAISDMQSGKIDLYVDGSLHLREGMHSINKIYSERQYLMTQKGNTSLSLRDSINNAMLELEEDEPYYNELLWYKYYSKSLKVPQKLTVEETSALKEKEVYNVGYHTNLQPISYKLKDGTPKGYAIDIMNILANKLGIKINYVPLHDGGEYSAKDLDFNLCPMNDGGSLYGNLSEPYDLQKMLVIKDEGIRKSEVKNILVHDYSTIEINDYLQLYPNATVHKSYSSKESKEIYEKFDIDCTIIPDNFEMFINDKKNKSISVLDVDVPMGIIVSNELPHEVLSALNKMILTLKETTVDEIVLDNVLALQATPTFMDMVMEYRIVITFIFFLIIVLFVLILLKHQKKIRTLLEVDTLTGVMTQYKFDIEARRILSFANPNEYMIIVLDVDKFKTINKVYGTQLGDKFLNILAKSIKKQTQRDAVIARVQSDSFAIFCETNEIKNVTLDDAFIKELKDIQIDMTIYFSIGVYIIENPKDDISYMIDNAKTARSYGKAIFGNTINYFTKELQEKHEKENFILSSMEIGIEDNEFFIVVQPKIELETKRLVGGEVLIRWHKKDGTFIYPSEFISLFEENKFIIRLDHYVLEKTCEFIRDSKLTLPVLSVNVSAVTMLEPNFVESGLNILSKYNVIPQQIEIELTESVLDFDFSRISNTISKLKQKGFSIAIDDFGKGASSLARIKEIEIDVLKLDKEFIDNNSENEKGRLVLSNFISMANDLGITSLAEGIETKEQYDLLMKLGCDQGQGYYFDKPLSTLEFMHRVESNGKVAYEPVIRYLKSYKFWNNSKDLPYGVAIARNNQYNTIIQANDAFYDIIGYTKDSFASKHNNRLVSILADNLYNIIQRYLKNNQYEFNFDLRVLTSSGEIVFVHDIVKYDPVDDLLFITLIKIKDKNNYVDGVDIQTNYLKQSMQVSSETDKLLHKIIDYYDCDRAYLVQINENDFNLNNYQEVLKTGVLSMEKTFSIKQYEFIQTLIGYLINTGTIYMNIDSLKDDSKYDILTKSYEKSQINSVVYTCVKDSDDKFLGFVGLDNPKKELSSFHLLENEASYIGAHIVQNKLNELDKMAHIQEENSKEEIVNLCINMLRTTSVTTDTTTMTVLDLLCNHYGAKSCVIVHFLQDEQSYKIECMNTELDRYPNLDIVKKLPYNIVEKVIDTFEENRYTLLNCSTDDFIDNLEERKIYDALGVKTGYLSPMFDPNNNCNGMLVVINPTLINRSSMLIQIVSKFLSDYKVKHDIYLEHSNKIAIEPLTKLLNKIVTEQEIEKLLQDGQNGSLYMVDVDNFKQINDKLGHVIGDEVIVDNARMLKELFSKHDIIGRVGGDEFLVFAPNITSIEEVNQKAKQILKTFEKNYGNSLVNVQSSASIGVCISHGKNTFKYLYHEADKALYLAKAQGKNQFCIAVK